MKKIEKYIYIVAALIIGTVLASAVTYVVIDKKYNNTSNNEQNVNNNKNNEEQITINEDKLKYYLSYVPNIDFAQNAYRDRNISDKVLISNALKHIIEDNKHKVDGVYIEINGEIFDYEFSVSSYNLNEYMSKMYNKNSFVLENTDINNSQDDYCTHRNGGHCFDYYNKTFFGYKPGLNVDKEHKSYIEDYNATENELIIYERAAYFELYDDNRKVTKSYINDTIIDSYVLGDYIEGYGSLYKHTFKKNDTGYYWYSTDYVEEVIPD